MLYILNYQALQASLIILIYVESLADKMTLKQNIRQLMDNTIFDIGFWDPLELLKDVDQARFDLFRTVETKHDHVAQLAILGHLITAVGVRLLGSVPFASVKNGLAALENISVTRSNHPYIINQSHSTNKRSNDL